MPSLSRRQPVARTNISFGNSEISVFMCSDIEIMADTCTEEKRSITSSRKSNKPLMEKRRRARINECLGQLKSLVLQAMKKDSTQYSKLEKADILEMTVKHLNFLQRQQIAAAMTSDPYLMGKYRAGFNECAGEVARYLDAVNVNHEVKSRVLNHLANCVSQIPNEAPQIHPAHLQAMHGMPPANQSAFMNPMTAGAPVWNLVTPVQQVQRNHVISPYSKFDRPRFTPSPEPRTLPDVRSSPESSPASSPDSRYDVDFSPKHEPDHTPPHLPPTPSFVSVKQEREVTPARSHRQELVEEGDKMWRPW